MVENHKCYTIITKAFGILRKDKYENMWSDISRAIIVKGVGSFWKVNKSTEWPEMAWISDVIF